MKRFLAIFSLVLLTGVLASSCGSQKQACAAYSSVEVHTPADNS